PRCQAGWQDRPLEPGGAPPRAGGRADAEHGRAEPGAQTPAAREAAGRGRGLSLDKRRRASASLPADRAAWRYDRGNVRNAAGERGPDPAFPDGGRRIPLPGGRRADVGHGPSRLNAGGAAHYLVVLRYGLTTAIDPSLMYRLLLARDLGAAGAAQGVERWARK